MVAAVLKFGGSLTPSDPQKNAVVIIGQPRYLSKINFSDVKMKLEPRVNEEVMYIDDTLQQLNSQTQSWRRVWRYQRGNQNPYIEEQTTQWPKEKGQKEKQRSTRHYT